MICNEFGTITAEGWKRIEEVFDYDKFSAFMKELTAFERLAAFCVIVSDMQTAIVFQGSIEEMNAYVEEEKRK